MKIYPKSRTEDIVVQELDNEVLVFDLTTNKAVCLNETAAIVWKMSDGMKEISEIAQYIRKKLRKPVTDEFIWLAIDQLKEENLLVNGEAIETKIGGLSRREVIGKVGIASMVALPIVTSIIAPKAIAAQSSCPQTTGGCRPVGSAICPLGCAGFRVNFRFFETADTTCTGPERIGSPTTHLCGPPGVNFGFPSIIDSIT